MLPVHIQKAMVMTQSSSSYTLENPLIKEIINQYEDTLPVVGQQLPFALSVSCGCVSSPKRSVKEKSKASATVNEDHKLLWRPKRWTSLLIAFFCTPNKSMRWFYFWQRQRYVWWRKFSAVPSQFSMSDIVQKSSEDQFMHLQMNFPWGSENLETVSLAGNGKLAEFFKSSDSANEVLVPSMVLCRTDLDFAVLAYLWDSFEEKLHQDKLKTVLRLNHRLAPYKVTVTIDGSDSTNSKKLSDLSGHLVKEFKQKSITVLPNPCADVVDLETQFEKFDEMGVPYVVVLSAMSMTTGLVGLRSRDTTLQEQVHIGELSEKLLLYLQMRVNEPD